MTYIAVWSEFVEQAKQLYCAQPARTRYVWKYRSADNEIVLKVTDDRTVLQYKTHQSNELKLMDSWTYIFLKLATSKEPNAHAVMAEIEEEKKAEREEKADGGKKKGGAGKQKSGK